MTRAVVFTARFRRAYHRLRAADQELVDHALRQLAAYLETRHASVGLGVKKLGPGLYEVRAGLALRFVYVEEGPRIVVALLGTHDDVRRFLRQQ